MLDLRKLVQDLRKAEEECNDTVMGTATAMGIAQARIMLLDAIQESVNEQHKGQENV